jgi:hypothetical protein
LEVIKKEKQELEVIGKGEARIRGYRKSRSNN